MFMHFHTHHLCFYRGTYADEEVESILKAYKERCSFGVMNEVLSWCRDLSLMP